MDAQEKKVLRWFWYWQDVEEEAWLRQMAQQGWHLRTIHFPGVYVFRQGQPRDVVYRLDYLKQRKDFEAYLQLFTDAGWERVCEFNYWQYFRIENTGAVPPEIFTDTLSKILKYRRVMQGMTAFQPVFFLMIIFARSGGPLYPAMAGFGMLMMIVLALNIVMLYRRINQLKRQ